MYNCSLEVFVGGITRIRKLTYNRSLEVFVGGIMRFRKANVQSFT